MVNSNEEIPADPLGRLQIKRHYALLLSTADVNVIQNTLRKMIDAEKMVMQDKGLKPAIRKMRQGNVDALSGVRDRIGFQVDQIDAAAQQKGSQGTKGV